MLIVGLGAMSTAPHILFLLADDYGWNDIGYHANHSAVGYYNGANPNGEQTTNAAAGIMKTPTLDSLAAEGVKLESYYVQPLCSPTRSTIMTGRYASHTGVGPDVLVENVPYGVPAREIFMAEHLKKAGYATHAVGKWHLGHCDNRYEATYRGFDSYQGYLHGAQSYWNHAGDYRNSTTLNDSAGETPVCSTAAQVNGIYSTTLEVAEVTRIVHAHPKGKPLFMYVALHSVHGPNEDPYPIVDVNKTFPEIVDHQRRIFAGMVLALDGAVANITRAYKDAGLWEDTVLVFSTDNGGIGSGNNFPLRGCKVLNWEGGIHGIGFVRGTDSSLAPVPAGAVTHELMHTTDWLPTLVKLGGGDLSVATLTSSTSTLPLDGVDQWPTIAHGKPTMRQFIVHNVPITALPVELPSPSPGKKAGLTTSTCLSRVDNRTGPCHAFGVTGGAVRVGDFKLLVSHPGRAPWEDSSPAGSQLVTSANRQLCIGQGTPGGRYPNGSNVFTPRTPTNHVAPYGNLYDPHLRRNVSVYLFNIKEDPTESTNLANTSTDKLRELLNFYNSYAARPDTVMGLSWRYGFQDPHASTVPPHPGDQHCQGEFNAKGGSPYCHYGREWECFVTGRAFVAATPLAAEHSATSTHECQAACARRKGCEWWLWRNASNSGNSGNGSNSGNSGHHSGNHGGHGSHGSGVPAPVCEAYASTAPIGGYANCTECAVGPAVCPGMMGTAGSPAAGAEYTEARAMAPETVAKFLSGTATFQHKLPPWAAHDIFDEMAHLDTAGFFSGTRSVRM